MQSDSSRSSTGVPTQACHDTEAQELETWAETIALTVAGTLEPSCALAFCFGNHQFLSERRAGEKPDVDPPEREPQLSGAFAFRC